MSEYPAGTMQICPDCNGTGYIWRRCDTVHTSWPCQRCKKEGLIRVSEPTPDKKERT
jgi:DnaJ-class molecular chaperone